MLQLFKDHRQCPGDRPAPGETNESRIRGLREGSVAGTEGWEPLVEAVAAEAAAEEGVAETSQQPGQQTAGRIGQSELGRKMNFSTFVIKRTFDVEIFGIKPFYIDKVSSYNR